MSLLDPPGHVVITGSSGAIGGAFARALRARQPALTLSLIDRDPAESERLAGELGGHCVVHHCDFDQPGAATRVFAAVTASAGPVDGLMSCAGFMQVRRFEAIPWEVAESLLRVDLLAPLELMQRAVAGMLERRRGFVVNVTSMAGRVPLKGCTFYGAAKAGLSMASEIAHVELRRRGVHVVTVYPGPVASRLEAGARAQYPDSFFARRFPVGDPAVLAGKVVDAIEGRKPRVIYPSLYSVGYEAVGLASRFTLAFGPRPLS